MKCNLLKMPALPFLNDLHEGLLSSGAHYEDLPEDARITYLPSDGLSKSTLLEIVRLRRHLSECDERG
jgi:hypothetical protein